MELTIWRPFAWLESFADDINQLFNETLGLGGRSGSSATAIGYPPVDVLESKDAYLLRAELPGMNKENFNLDVKNGILTISGERKLEELVRGVQYRTIERVAGEFSRSFHLPETVQQDGIQATYRDGILEIYVPKLEHAKARQIIVN